MSYLSWAALVAGILALALSGWLWRRLRILQSSLTTTQNDLRALGNAAIGVGERAAQVDRQVRLLAAQQAELGLRQERLDNTDNRTFDQAIKMVRKGASVDELVEICGLSRGEAELVAMMHRINGNNGQ